MENHEKIAEKLFQQINAIKDAVPASFFNELEKVCREASDEMNDLSDALSDADQGYNNTEREKKEIQEDLKEQENLVQKIKKSAVPVASLYDQQKADIMVHLGSVLLREDCEDLEKIAIEKFEYYKQKYLSV